MSIHKRRKSQRHESKGRLPTRGNSAGYDEALAGREADGGESLLSGRPRNDRSRDEEVEVPDRPR